MGLNQPWKDQQWWPVYTAMARIVHELRRQLPPAGLAVVQADGEASGDVGI
jgi:hypothetical protein